jgi:arginine decarboxylase-like protein
VGEQLYLNMCHEVQKQLDPSNRAHRPIIDELQERMADKIYVNFSLFQSMPDAWGIDQLFPVLPLEGLNHPERRAVLLDITCDSDGAIDHYVDGDGIADDANAGIRPGEPADAGLLYGRRVSGDPRQHAQPVRRYRSG